MTGNEENRKPKTGESSIVDLDTPGLVMFGIGLITQRSLVQIQPPLFELEGVREIIL